MVWGDRVFVTSAVDQGDVTDPAVRADSHRLASEMSMDPAQDRTAKSWRVLCLDKHTGEVLWDRTAHSGAPRARRHPLNSFATPTAAVDGRHVVVFFGSEGLYCYTLEGELIWQRSLGNLRAGYYLDSELEWGVASSVLLHRGMVIVQCDVSDSPFIVALDVETGREIWRAEGDDFPSWSTPAVFRDQGQDQGRSVLVGAAPNYVRGLDAASGEELWRPFLGVGLTTPAPLPPPAAWRHPPEKRCRDQPRPSGPGPNRRRDARPQWSIHQPGSGCGAELLDHRGGPADGFLLPLQLDDPVAGDDPHGEDVPEVAGWTWPY